jgi:hypothetical protein
MAHLDGKAEEMKALGIYLILFVAGTLIYSCATRGPDPMSYAAASPASKQCIDAEVFEINQMFKDNKFVRKSTPAEQWAVHEACAEWYNEIREGHKAITE